MTQDQALPLHANILVVDDNRADLRLLVEMLDGRGHAIRPTLDGPSALAGVQAELPDLVLLDVQMPRLDGYQVCQRLKADARTRDIPVIFISASDEVFDKMKAFEVGGVDYVTKPFQAEEVLARVETHCRLRQQTRALAQANEQLAAANQELSAFSYSVSHDLRAPLRVIDGYARVLVEDYGPSLDTEGTRLCAVVRQETQRMGQLIDDLLTLSRLGRLDMRIAPIDMETLVDEGFRESTLSTERDRIDLQVGSLPPVAADRSLVRQVWLNLLDNAVKFSSKKQRARVEVGGREDVGENTYWVRDNGAGFDMQYAGKLFGVFQRLHSVRDFKGTGVGLAIVQRVINRHGGRVWAEAEEDRGATFFFTLPREAQRRV